MWFTLRCVWGLDLAPGERTGGQVKEQSGHGSKKTWGSFREDMELFAGLGGEKGL